MKIYPNLLKLLALLYVTSCGSTVEENHSKHYVLAYQGDNERVNQALRDLVSEFNQLTGAEVLKYTDDTTKANSFISLTKGLENRDQKIGWGQWITSTSEGESFSHHGHKIDREIDYSMSIELDWDYVVSRLNGNSEKHYELQKLLFHEIGHGLQMSHSEDPKNLMYAKVNGQKNFDEFFARVRKFFNVKG